MDKTKIVLISFVIAAFFIGCGDKKSDESAKSKVAVKQAGAIKVTQNAVKTEKKVKSKENGGQFYYSYNEEDKSKEAKSIDKYQEDTAKQRTTIDAYLHIRSPYERIKMNLMINKLSHDFIIHCSACHDDYGNGIIGPSLLGKDGNYIYKKLMDFKSGKTKNVLMKGLVSQMDDALLKSIADEIADFNAKLLKIRNGK